MSKTPAMTAPTTKPKRFNPKIVIAPKGKWKHGINNGKILSRVGAILTIWSHVEERMVPFFAELTGLEWPGPARLVFRSMVNHKARVDIMRAMLEKSPLHLSTGGHYDAIIDEFSKLAQVRNEYAHGLWFTHEDGKRVFLDQDTKAYFPFLNKRRVTEKELDQVNARTNKLLSDLLERHWEHSASLKDRRDLA